MGSSSSSRKRRRRAAVGREWCSGFDGRQVEAGKQVVVHVWQHKVGGFGGLEGWRLW